MINSNCSLLLLISQQLMRVLYFVHLSTDTNKYVKDNIYVNCMRERNEDVIDHASQLCKPPKKIRPEGDSNP